MAAGAGHMTMRARAVARHAIDVFNGITGLRLSAHTARFAGQDAGAVAMYLTSRSARRAERSAVDSARTPADWLAVSRTHFGVGPVQMPDEIFGLMELAEENDTRVACEIGAQDAGSSLLFSRSIAGLETLIVIDLFVKNRWRLRRAAPAGQTVHTIDGDSSHPMTVKRLRRKLAGRQLDFLLIDGDHRFAGVRRDFLTYRHLVRDGGLIAFHDIMPVRTSDSHRDVGDVPAFWELVKPLYPSREFVADRWQDGLGIGVLSYDPSVSVKPIEARGHIDELR
jgi:cephalosporin hydroxylase